MTGQTKTEQHPLATVDVHELRTLRWGPIRQLFPAFVEEIELGRYVKRLLNGSQNHSVAIEPHPDASGRKSSYLFDVYRVETFEPGA